MLVSLRRALQKSAERKEAKGQVEQAERQLLLHHLRIGGQAPTVPVPGPATGASVAAGDSSGEIFFFFLRQEKVHSPTMAL